jgi:hypothetical protein
MRGRRTSVGQANAPRYLPAFIIDPALASGVPNACPCATCRTRVRRDGSMGDPASITLDHLRSYIARTAERCCTGGPGIGASPSARAAISRPVIRTRARPSARGGMMKGFVQGVDRQQATLLPECLDDWVDESNPVRAVDVFVDALELRDLGFDGVDPAATGRPAYHPSSMLKLYIFGYLNRVQSSRRLEREAGRNLEVMWLTGRFRITKPSPISAKTTAPPSRRSARNSSPCAARWGC